MKRKVSRRSALQTVMGSAALLGSAAGLSSALAAEEQPPRPKLKGHIHHSVSAWCYGSLFNPGKNKPAKMTFEDFCQTAPTWGWSRLNCWERRNGRRSRRRA